LCINSNHLTRSMQHDRFSLAWGLGLVFQSLMEMGTVNEKPFLFLSQFVSRHRCMAEDFSHAAMYRNILWIFQWILVHRLSQSLGYFFFLVRIRWRVGLKQLHKYLFRLHSTILSSIHPDSFQQTICIRGEVNGCANFVCESGSFEQLPSAY
jgi:hypothetical protein